MPRRNDLHRIMIVGSGPIIIGQACEFDYSGAQACKALREEGYRVILVNSNPATIMTDPGTAHRTYIEPITWQYVEKIIERERPDAVLPTLGGQTALNLAMALFERGLVGVPGTPELIGANADNVCRVGSLEALWIPSIDWRALRPDIQSIAIEHIQNSEPALESLSWCRKVPRSHLVELTRAGSK